MKQLTIFLLLSLFLWSCNKPVDEPKKEENKYLSEWRYAGFSFNDGGGTDYWTLYEGDDVLLRILDENTLELNHELCHITNSNIQNWQNITYDSTYVYHGCDTTDIYIESLYYSISDSILIISYPCIEPCTRKYIRNE